MDDQRARRSRPNVVLIVLDDLGFGEVGCYGSDIATPRIDTLAEHGLRYNNFHVTALCSPTRACLITGRNHHAVGMGYLPEGSIPFPAYSGRIPESAGTLPRLLRDTGYSTFAVGKWHLTPRSEEGPAGPFDRWPLGMGFERFYGFMRGLTDQWTPDLVRDNGFINPPASPDEGYHLTEDLASQAIRLVQDQQQAAPGRPFFLYLATGATHGPHQAPREWIETYRGRFDDGWDVVRNQTFLRQQKLGLIPPETTLTERPSWVAPWESHSSDERRVLARQMEAYAGFLSHTDAQIGRLLDFLGTLEVLDNTLIMILSDNGAAGHGGPHGSLSLQARDVETMLDRIDEFGGFQSFGDYASGWAWAGNAPFRLWKRYTWLGGVRVPLIIHWPQWLSADNDGQVRTQFCHAIDLMPTILEAAGVNVPDVLDGVSQQPIDGTSLLRTIDEWDCPSPRNTQYFEMLGSRAIYHDGWKATTDHVPDAEENQVEGSRDFDTDRWSLFCLDNDFSEAHDVAAGYPNRLRQMIDLWWHEAGRNRVLPLTDVSFMRRDAPTDVARDQYVYRPGGGPISTPSLMEGFRLAAEVEVPEGGEAAGIVCAQGDRNGGGWALYALGGRLTAAFVLGDTRSQFVSDEVIPARQHMLDVTFRPESADYGEVSIGIDGDEVAGGPVSARWGTVWYVSHYTKLLVGRDRGFPVCDDYQPPFPFTGRVHRVVLQVPSSTGAEGSHQEIASALRHD